MQLPENITIDKIAQIIDCKYIGDSNHAVSGINEIHKVVPGDLVFVDHPKYYEKALQSDATTILINKKVDFPKGKALLISKNPFDDFNKLTRHFSPPKKLLNEIGENTQIANSAVISPNVTIGNEVQIGENVQIFSGASILDRTIIEDNVIIGPNTTIGHAAFYYKRKPKGYDRMYSCGNVHIQKNVEIGANCAIDAGVTGTTEIGEGTKIDNLVHIGHDTVTGKHCLLAANVGLAGCVILEDEVTLWGQVGCAADVVIGKGAIVLAQSGISKSLAGGKTYFGSPCGEVKSKYREMAAIRKLPELLKKSSIWKL